MDKRNNKVINEIMSNSSSSIIVLSSSDCASTSFLSELSNRYPTTYWFNALFDDPFSFALDIAEKVLNNDETYQKMIQLKYSDNAKVDNIILNVTLEDIKKRQGDCLFVFENMEKLPENFNFSLLELLIKNCPKNLKLIFISETLINLNYNKLEQCAPKIVDEFSLGVNLQSSVVDIDTTELSDIDIHFLAYISSYNQVPIEFVSSIYPNGINLLRFISLKYNNLVINKGNCCFGISNILHNITMEKSKKLNESPFKEDLTYLLYKFFDSKGKYINSFRIAMKMDNLDYIQNSLNNITNHDGYLYRLFEFAKFKVNALNEKYITIENFICYGYSIICDYEAERYKDALKKLDKLMALENIPQILFIRCSYLKVKVLMETNDYHRGVDFIRSTINDYKPENIKNFESIICFLPEFLHNTDQNIQIENFKLCEKYLNTSINPKSYLYIKMLQSMSEAYFDLGNYRKAIVMVQTIKASVPFYIVPFKLLQYFYYMNDPLYAEKVGLNAIQIAKENDISVDEASIYCLLGKVYAFWGMKNEALFYVDKAVECKDSCDFIKYYSIALRVMTYARFSKKEFIKDIALIYAKQCEQINSRYSFLIYGSVSYWYWHNGLREEAQFYANKCLSSTNSKTGLWFIASGVALNYALEDESNVDLRQIVSKFFYTSEQYAMDMVIADFDDCYNSIIKYAVEHNLNIEYVTKLQTLIKNKVFKEDNSPKVKIQVMSSTSVVINGAEIQWKTKKARELFMIYIINSGAGIDRAKIFSLLWSEYIYESAINNLKTTNNIIRNTLTKYGIDFKLEYKNGKYNLVIKNCDFDYEKYKNYIEKFNEETVLAEKINLMLDIINLYGTGFAPELNNNEFKELNLTLKQNLCLMLVEFIKLLVEKGRLIDARKFLNALSKVDDLGKYQDIISKFEERKHI